MGLETEIIPHLEDEFAGEVMVPAHSIPGRVQKVIRRIAGGTMIYVGNKDLAPRDEEIRRLFTGNNFQELVDRFDLSEMRIRQIVKQKNKRF